MVCKYEAEVGWSRTMTGLSVRAFLFLIINVVMQGYLVFSIGMALMVWQPYSGKMHLCNFGTAAEVCTSAARCRVCRQGCLPVSVW